MRLPTVNQFNSDMNAISKQYDQIQILQDQVRTGKKLQQSSDNPLLAGEIASVTDFIQTIKGYDLNGTLAASRASLLDTKAAESVNIISLIQERLVHAQSDTVTNSERNNIALELKGYMGDLLKIANFQDNSGEYIFSGLNVNVTPYSNAGGAYIYQGGQEQTRIAISSQTSVPYNESGYRIFSDIKTGNGLFTLSADALNNTGTGVASTGRLMPNTPLVMDDYKITIVTNSSGNLAYQVIGAQSGQLIPLPPLLTPGNAPEYIPGSEIAFNGISLQINGQPNPGDVFNVNPSSTQSIFSTLQSLINTLNTPVNSEKDKADLHQALNGQSSSFSQILDHFRQYSAEIGNREKMIDDQVGINKNTLINQEKLLDSLANADMPAVISNLTQQLSTLEITQQSYLKIQDTFSSLLQHFLMQR